MHDACRVEGEGGIVELVADELGRDEVAAAGGVAGVVDEVAIMVRLFHAALAVAALQVDPGGGVTQIEAGRIGGGTEGDGAAEGFGVNVLAGGVFEGGEVSVGGLDDGGGTDVGEGGEPVVVRDVLLDGGVEAVALGYLFAGVGGLLGGVAVVACASEVGEGGIPIARVDGGLAGGVVADLGLLVPPLVGNEAQHAGDEGTRPG